MKNNLIDERVSGYIARARMILSENLPDKIEKAEINKIRLDCMRRYCFYGPERARLDHYIRTELDKREKRKRRESQKSAIIKAS